MRTHKEELQASEPPPKASKAKEKIKKKEAAVDGKLTATAAASPIKQEASKDVKTDGPAKKTTVQDPSPVKKADAPPQAAASAPQPTSAPGPNPDTTLKEDLPSSKPTLSKDPPVPLKRALEATRPEEGAPKQRPKIEWTSPPLPSSSMLIPPLEMSSKFQPKVSHPPPREIKEPQPPPPPPTKPLRREDHPSESNRGVGSLAPILAQRVGGKLVPSAGLVQHALSGIGISTMSSRGGDVQAKPATGQLSANADPFHPQAEPKKSIFDRVQVATDQRKKRAASVMNEDDEDGGCKGEISLPNAKKVLVSVTSPEERPGGGGGRGRGRGQGPGPKQAPPATPTTMTDAPPVPPPPPPPPTATPKADPVKAKATPMESRTANSAVPPSVTLLQSDLEKKIAAMRAAVEAKEKLEKQKAARAEKL